jgi:hypothetical protein
MLCALSLSEQHAILCIQNFQDLPTGEARRYGDKIFRAMMFAKGKNAIFDI